MVSTNSPSASNLFMCSVIASVGSSPKVES